MEEGEEEGEGEGEEGGEKMRKKKKRKDSWSGGASVVDHISKNERESTPLALHHDHSSL